MRLKEKVAIVTGGGTGIGRAIALRFGLEGAAVMVTGRREVPVRSVAEEIRQAGGRAETVIADVSRPGDAERIVGATLDAFGRLDILVNNAGLIVGRWPAADTTDEQWARTLDVNLTGAFRCSRAALAALAASRGVVLNIASGAGL
jgi:3-oxoacyl-[acyl-carrier protein] reductase